MEKKTSTVGLAGQTILAIIPSVITQLIAFYRIKKFRHGVLMELGIIGLATGLQFFLGFPWGIIGVVVVQMAIPVYFVRKWTRDFNTKIR